MKWCAHSREREFGLHAYTFIIHDINTSGCGGRLNIWAGVSCKVDVVGKVLWFMLPAVSLRLFFYKVKPYGSFIKPYGFKHVRLRYFCVLLPRTCPNNSRTRVLNDMS